MVANYLCCYCPQVILIHNLLAQLLSFSSNIPSFNRHRSVAEMKWELVSAIFEPSWSPGSTRKNLNGHQAFWKVVTKNLFASSQAKATYLVTRLLCVELLKSRCLSVSQDLHSFSWDFDFNGDLGPEKLPGFSRNGPLVTFIWSFPSVIWVFPPDPNH